MGAADGWTVDPQAGGARHPAVHYPNKWKVPLGRLWRDGAAPFAFSPCRRRFSTGSGSIRLSGDSKLELLGRYNSC